MQQEKERIDLLPLLPASFHCGRFVNLEIMVRIESPEAAAHIRERIDRMAEESIHVTKQIHDENNGFFTRIYRSVAYFLVSTMDKTVSGGIGRTED